MHSKWQNGAQNVLVYHIMLMFFQNDNIIYTNGIDTHMQLIQLSHTVE